MTASIPILVLPKQLHTIYIGQTELFAPGHLNENKMVDCLIFLV